MDKKITHSPLRTFTRKYLKFVLGGCAFGVLALAYSSNNSELGRVQMVSSQSLSISTVSQGQFNHALKLRGSVQPKTSVFLDTLAGGRVEQRLVEQGAYVKKGDPLVRLSNTALQLDVMGREAQVTEQLNFLRNTQMTMATNRLNLRRDLLEIELQLGHLERKLKQTKELVKKGVVARERLAELTQDLAYYKGRKELTLERQKQEEGIRQVQVAQLEDSAKMLQNNLAFARKNLENLTVRAPVSGHLSALNVELGESKRAGARLGQIDIPDQFKLEANLDEFYLNQVNLGMRAIVQVGAAQYETQISKIDSEVANAQFAIEINLPEQISEIKRGQSLDLELMLAGNASNAILLERGAFFSSSGGHWVFVLTDNGTRAERRAIKLGKKNQEHYQVLSGLTAGEQVITSSYSHFDKADALVLN